MFISITQGKEWQKLQDDLGRESHFERQNDYQYLAITHKTPVGNYLFLPYGPVAKNEAAFKKALESLQTLAKEKSTIFIRLEPRSPLEAKYLPFAAKKVKDIDPAETWILKIDKNNWQDVCPSRLLRYYRNKEKQGITLEKSKNPEDIHYLLDLQKQLADKKHIKTYSEKYLQTELKQPFATLYLLKQNQEVLAAGLVFDDKTTKTRYNLQGAQSDDGRKAHATGILTIELIKDAAEQGMTTFDFWGVAPDNAPDDHPWKGFTQFKKTFNGSEQHYAGTYDLPLKPFKYHLFQTLKRLL